MPEPKSSMRTKVYHASTVEDLTDESKRKYVAYVQGIPEFLKAPEGIKYSAVDIPDKREAEGKQEIGDFEIEFLFTEEQYDELKEIEKSKKDEVWAIQLPEETAITTGKPLTWYWKGTCFVGMSEIADEEILKSKVKIYRSSEIKESKGFPTT